MFGEFASVSTPSIWASMNSWFTPNVFFVLLNVMIGTIVITSSLANQRRPQQPQQAQDDSQQPKIAKSPSVLQRLKSINLYSYKSQEPHPSPSIANHYKENTDSDTHFPLQQTLESHTQYVFAQIHEQQTPEEAQSQYIFEQTHQQRTQETQTQYVFPQEHEQQTLEEAQSQYIFEQLHQQRSEEIQTQYVFQQTLEEETPKSDIKYNLQQNHDESEEEEEGHEEVQTLDEVYSHFTDRHFSSDKSGTKPASSEVPAKVPTMMRKSASLKSDFGHSEEEDIVESRRPATVRETNARVTDWDEEVDAKAGDFINKFKQQLKLQRLDSIIRSKDMIGGGSGK
ncbi:unnamed protein product [Ilex paraguariensis]|uniref:DUF4408 domain-containing protein n=1 Tax=Ilex paraguariensis TaxID=185542 RepID=A0ABC8UGA4_9AQUA